MFFKKNLLRMISAINNVQLLLLSNKIEIMIDKHYFQLLITVYKLEIQIRSDHILFKTVIIIDLKLHNNENGRKKILKNDLVKFFL